MLHQTHRPHSTWISAARRPALAACNTSPHISGSVLRSRCCASQTSSLQSNHCRTALPQQARDVQAFKCPQCALQQRSHMESVAAFSRGEGDAAGQGAELVPGRSTAQHKQQGVGTGGKRSSGQLPATTSKTGSTHKPAVHELRSQSSRAKGNRSRSNGSERASWHLKRPKRDSTSTRPQHGASIRGSQEEQASRKRTTSIKSCSTLDELQQQVRQYGSRMDYINVAAAVHQLQQLCGKDTSRHNSHLALDQLWQLLQLQLSQCTARELANVLWAASRLQYRQAELYAACLQQYVSLADRSTRQLSNVVYAMCQAPAAIQQHYWAAVQQHILPAFLQQIEHANAQDISNALYALADSRKHLGAEQLQQLLNQFVRILSEAKSQEISNTLWAVATMQQHVPPGQLQQLLGALAAKVQHAKPQGISNTLWAVATMGQQVPPSQLLQLLGALITKVQHAKPQEISNTLWAVPTMGQQVPPELLQQLLGALVTRMHTSNAQDVSNTLWALATAGADVPREQLRQLLERLASVLHTATSQHVANTVWACAGLRYIPHQLLSAPAFHSKLAAASPQEIASIAWALGQLGHRDEQVIATALQMAVQWAEHSRLGPTGSTTSSAWNTQELCNLCWSVAVLDFQQHAGSVLKLAAACSGLWVNNLAPAELQQLHQVHTWLLDCQLAGGQGLAGALTAEQLQQCKQAWGCQMQARASQPPTALQQSVHAALSSLPSSKHKLTWQEQPKMEQLSKGRGEVADGALLIDITAGFDGVRLAIEADGPTHFTEPDRQLTGPTQYRNRALAHRGYAVISIPYHEWDIVKKRSLEQQHEYLVQQIRKAVKLQQQQQQQQQAHGRSRQQSTEQHLSTPIKAAAAVAGQAAGTPDIVSSSGRVRRIRRRIH